MAENEEEKPEEGAEEEAPNSGGKKLKIIAGSSVLVLFAVAYMAALMAVPKKETTPQFAGPFVSSLTAGKQVQVNLSDSKSFLILDLNLVYDSYDEAYFLARIDDPLCTAEIKDALVALASAKTRADVSDKVNKPVFMEEIKAAVDPIIFPVHIGGGGDPTAPDPESGLRPGFSAHQGQFRGSYEEHVLRVDAVGHTLQLDDGPVVEFFGDETDLLVPDAQGLGLYVDVTGLVEDFAGELKVGVKGRARRILWNEILIQ